MFGYVRVWKPELKMVEFELYQGVYCTLCKRLGKRYGAMSRMTLSYDFTFLALLRMALSADTVHFQKGRCPYNPLKKRQCCLENPEVDFAADAATLLTYYKLQDTIADAGFWKGLSARFLLLFASRSHRKAAQRYPDLEQVIASCMEKQAALEQAKTASIDVAAEPSAQMLSYLAQMGAANDRDRLILERFGYCLGRWIYLVDAVDDLPDDLKEGAYNPYIVSRQLRLEEEERIRETQSYAVLTLNACLAECVAAYNLLEIHRFDGILRNILEWGMPAAQKQAVTPKRRSDECERSV